jgi:HEAT repeat protein
VNNLRVSGRRAVAGLCLAAAAWAGCVKNECRIDASQAHIDAKTVLRQAAEDPSDAVTRRAAMQAISEVLGESGGVLKQALDDPDEGVRFAAAMAIGDIRYAPALPLLQEKVRMYTGERDKRTYCGILYALFRLGDVSHLGELADLLFDRDPDVRAVAAQVMGKVGNTAAIPLLKTALADERKEKPQYNITEALALLGDDGAQTQLEAFATSAFIDLQLEALPAVGREYSRQGMAVLREVAEDRYHRYSPRARVRAAGVMARLGQTANEGYVLCLQAASRPESFSLEQVSGDSISAGFEVASLQQLAAISLGWMGRRDSLCSLHPLLMSPQGGVRVAAAMSIMRLTGGAKKTAPPPAPPPAVEPQSRPAASQPATLRTSGAKD